MVKIFVKKKTGKCSKIPASFPINLKENQNNKLKFIIIIYVILNKSICNLISMKKGQVITANNSRKIIKLDGRKLGIIILNWNLKKMIDLIEK